MNPAKIVTETKRRIVCPHCEKPAGTVDHLLGTDTWTRWYCDECGKAYTMQFSASGSVSVEPSSQRKIETLDVLVLRPQDKPVYFVVSGMRFTGERGGDDSLEAVQGHKEFYYETHSCPTNWLEPEMLYYDGDSDPHGLVEFVAWRDAESFPPDENHGPNAHDQALTDFIQAVAASPPPREDEK